MQIGLTGVTAAQASSLNMININLHVGMRLFQEHLKLLFVPIIKLNHIINDSLEKFVLILHLVIKALEVHQLNIKHILLSMYKAFLKITVRLGNIGVDNVNRSIILLVVGITLVLIGFKGTVITAASIVFLSLTPVFVILLLLGITMVLIGTILSLLGFVMYLTTFGSMTKKVNKFKKTLIELYPDISLKNPQHRKISWKDAKKQGEKDAKKLLPKIPKSLRKN